MAICEKKCYLTGFRSPPLPLLISLPLPLLRLLLRGEARVLEVDVLNAVLGHPDREGRVRDEVVLLHLLAHSVHEFNVPLQVV